MIELTDEQKAAADAANKAALRAQEARAAEEAKAEARRNNRFHFTVRGFGAHHTGSDADVDALCKKFVADLRAAGVEVMHAESGCGDVGREQLDTY